MEALTRPGRNRRAAYDRQRPLQDEPHGASPEDHVAGEIARLGDVCGYCCEGCRRCGRARRIGRLVVVRSRAIRKDDRGTSDRAPRIIKHHEVLGRDNRREYDYSKHAWTLRCRRRRPPLSGGNSVWSPCDTGRPASHTK